MPLLNDFIVAQGVAPDREIPMAVRNSEATILRDELEKSAFQVLDRAKAMRGSFIDERNHLDAEIRILDDLIGKITGENMAKGIDNMKQVSR